MITNGVKAVIGKLKSDPKGATHVQTYVFDKDRFDTKAKVSKWLQDNGKEESIDIESKEEAYVPLNDARIEYVGPDKDYPDAKIWKVTALTVTISDNKRRYSKEELEEAAFTLSYRPIDINHASTRIDKSLVLPYPENATGLMYFDSNRNAIVGALRITDPEVNAKIESGVIKHVSVSQMSNEMCVDAVCSSKLQYGMAFTRLALLEGLPPGDNNTSITKMESVLLADLLTENNDNSVNGQDAAEESVKGKGPGKNPSKDEAEHGDCPPGQHWCADEGKCMPDAKAKDECDTCGSYPCTCVTAPDPAAELLRSKEDLRYKELYVLMTELVKQHPGWTYDELRDAANEQLGITKVEATSPLPNNSVNAPDSSGIISNKDMPQPNADVKTADPKNDGKPVVAPAVADGNTPGSPPPAKDEAHADPAFITAFLNEFKAYEQKHLEKLSELIGITKVKNESASSATPSSMVDDSQLQARKAMMQKAEAFFGAIKNQTIGDIGPAVWNLNKLDYFNKWGRWIYGKPEAVKEEAVTLTAGAVGANVIPDILLLPGGRMMKPVRQFVDVKPAPIGTDTVTFNKIDTFNFGAITPGTEPTNPTQTVTPVNAAVALRGAVQSVSFPQIHDVGALISAINDSMALASIADEATELLTTTFDAVTDPFWINGNTGAEITSDDVAGMTLTPDALAKAITLLEKEGLDTSPGRLFFAVHPKNYRELRMHADLIRYVQQGDAKITRTGILDELFGATIVVTNAMKAAANTTNAVFRNVLAVKGEAFGLGVADEVTMEATRRGELFQVKLSGYHRLKGAVKDKKRTVRISNAQ